MLWICFCFFLNKTKHTQTNKQTNKNKTKKNPKLNLTWLYLILQYHFYIALLIAADGEVWSKTFNSSYLNLRPFKYRLSA